MFRKILLVILVLLCIAQVIRPEKNLSDNTTKNIGTIYAVPANVRTLLATACADCHSNKTIYPWYAEVQPVGWWLNNHINEGKRHFNLDEFTGRQIGYQYKKMDDCIDELKDGGMPLDSYTWIHHNARLGEADRKVLIDWCEGVKKEISAKYPPDSLVIPKRVIH